jgi:hypothetical protein
MAVEDREQRINIAKKLMALGPDILKRNPAFRQILKDYGNKGVIRPDVPRAFRETIWQFEQIDLEDTQEKELRRIAGTGYVSMMDVLLGNPADALEAPPLPKQRSRGWFGLPRGAMIPLAFIGLFLFLGGVMGLLLVVVIGQSAINEAFFETEEGRSLLATVIVVSLVGSLWGWFSRRVGFVFSLARIILMVVFALGVGLLGTQVFLIDPEKFETVAESNNAEMVTIGVFLLSIVTSLLMFLRRMVMSMVWLVIFLVLVVVIGVLAVQSGMIDLSSLVP